MIGPLALLLLLTLGTARAEAQREGVEDSWPQAEAAMAGDAGARSSASGLDAPGPPARPPRLRRSRRQTRDIELQRQARDGARARSAAGGPLTLELRGAPPLDWVWLGRVEEPPPRFAFTQGPSLCAAACRLHLRPGRYRFGVRDSALHGAVAQPITIERSGVLLAHYDSANARRRGGVALMLLGTVPAVVGVVAAFLAVPWFCDSEFEDCDFQVPLYAKLSFFGGLAMLAAGATLVVTARRRLTLELRPGLAR